MAKVLAVFAHPDDETFICGGTLAKAAGEGHEVILVCGTKGQMGRRMGVPPTETRETICRVREEELYNACKVLGIQMVHFLGYRDKTLEIQDTPTLKSRVLEHVLREQPSVLVTFHPELGGHADHCVIGRAATAAALEYGHTCLIDVYYVCSGNMIRNPEACGLRREDLMEIDVSQYLHQKLYAFRAHRTQTEMNDWLWEEDSMSVLKLWPNEFLIRHKPLKSAIQVLAPRENALFA